MKKKKVLEIYNDVEKLKVYYPEAFEKELGEDLEVNNWYWNKEKDTLVFIDNLEKDIYYGFFMGEYNRWSFSKNYNKKGAFKATAQEIETALIKEAEKRGFKNGRIIIPLKENNLKKSVIDLGFKTEFLIDNNEFWMGGYCLFKDGQWAKIIPSKQMTKEEIEKELGYNIEII